MAIRFRASALSGPFEYISRHDEAVDIDAKDFESKWEQYRDGAIPEPPLRQGFDPTRWELTPITSSRQRSYLQGYHEKHGNSALFVAYAASGISGVSNLLDAEGKPVDVTTVKEDGYNVLTEDLVSMIPVQILIEIGTVLITHDMPKKT